MKRILICANPDLNYIDGSSIWAQTIALALAGTGMASVDFLMKSAIRSPLLFDPLQDHPRIRLIHGPRLYRDAFSTGAMQSLSPGQMAQAAIHLDREGAYDIILVRGYDIVQALAHNLPTLQKLWLYLTDIPQSAGDLTEDDRWRLPFLARQVSRILCQSDGFIRLWQQIAPGMEPHKFLLYTPVTPDPPAAVPGMAARPRHAVYAGKFRPEWNTLDMTRLWPGICAELPDARLIVMGDKIHDAPDRPDYKAAMRHALENTEGVEWRGAQTREDAMAACRNARLGLSWRNAEMDDTLEYSTKILEYGAAGCAAILNRNGLHEHLLGRDYPLFANTDDEFSRAVLAGLRDDALAEDAAARMMKLAGDHSFSRRVGDLARWLSEETTRDRASTAPRTRGDGRKLNVLVAGHDLKFFMPMKDQLEKSGEIAFSFDQWAHHNRHDPLRSQALLAEADVIFCEWCLGNLAWYSRNKHPDQRLIARFHSQERYSTLLDTVNFDALSHISFVCDFIRDEVGPRIPVDRDKTSVISNYFDVQRFKATKKFGNAAHTLGMIGYVPAQKNLGKAVDLLEKLLARDPRYKLRIKGKSPFDYSWMKNRPEELEYYESLMSRINSNDNLRYRVIFDPHGDDVEKWLNMVGFVLSPSEYESFHMSVGEGMLMDCAPVIWDWPGARTLWPQEYIVSSTDEAADLILGKAGKAENDDMHHHRAWVLDRHSPESVIEQWTRIITGKAPA